MATPRLPADFKEFLNLLNSERVEYLLVGGYAIIHYAKPRATGDMDIGVNPSPHDAERVVRVLNRFGFRDPSITPARFSAESKVFRMGVPPLRIELLTPVSGLTFEQAFAHRRWVTIDSTEVSLIDLNDLKINQRAAGRRKDLDDWGALP